ncbi:MAG: translation initiation factor IF-2 [Phycisphaeraceae bacterium]|nr:translation initiation factor IF-2 [Phycisphaerae bacterium]MBX3393074.1 translation initiation factor IF-2 [Phycisphaeraceae bacterium]
MAQKRIFEIAKELNVESKLIIQKCWDEGISKDVVKNHMSAVTIGLAESIKEWFHAGGSQVATAVETAAKIDQAAEAAHEARKTTPRRAKAASAGANGHRLSGDAESDGSTAQAVAEAPPPVAPVVPAADSSGATAVVTRPSHASAAPTRLTPPELDRPGRSAETPTPPAAPSPPVKPAPMNIPTRPTVVSPAGQKLEVQKVRLSGPKVVRVEAPEQVESPRPRRPAGPGTAGSGPRPGGSGSEEDDRGRSPRRTKGPAPAPVGPKRTTGISPNRRASADWSTPGIYSEQDLIEREARLARAGGTIRKHRQDLNRGPSQRAETAAETGGVVRITAPFTIKDLSAATGVKGAEILKRLFNQGILTTINAGLDPAKAQEIMLDFDIELEVQEARTAEQTVHADYEQRKMVDERPRGPVVTILGHVDHGKTSLLDRIRNANVAAGEAGGITQRTSAFRAKVSVGGDTKEVVFLDTPGHEAFTSMRSRGATMTDVVVLVVSAPEGVMPQTVESINHAKAAKVPLVVALNKIDRPDATENAIQKTLGQLAEHGLNSVQWGGDTEVVKVSAVTGEGIPELLETLDYQAQLRDLKADFGGMAAGTVIEARTEEGRGAVASLLIQQGRLKVGDFIVAGRAYGRVRDMTDDTGVRVREDTPPHPVVISGIDEVPDAGDRFYVVDSLKKAQDAAEQRRRREREQQLAAPKVTLDSFFSQIAEKETKEILIVLKAAEQGTVDVLRSEVEKIKTDEVKVRVLHAAVGGITESDVVLAQASRAIIIGFNVIPSGKSRTMADHKGVEIRTYQVIYHITDDLKQAAEGLLSPELRQEILGHAEVRQVFKVSKVGTIAGCYVTDGNVQRDALIRVTRSGVVIENDRRLEQLKRFKDDAKEVRAGMECGMKIVGYDDIKEGDILECYKQVEVKRTL